jgi:hypothetical protein
MDLRQKTISRYCPFKSGNVKGMVRGSVKKEEEEI